MSQTNNTNTNSDIEIYECPDCEGGFVSARARDGHLSGCPERSTFSPPKGEWNPESHGRWGDSV